MSAHPVGDLLRGVALGSAPPVDGLVEVLPRPAGVRAAVLGFTGHHVVAADVVKATMARFARSFGLAIRSGVPAVQALTMVAATVENVHIARKIEAMREGVERGESVLRTAVATGIFTPIVLQMVAVGEETGALDDLMTEIAEMYQREVEYDLKSLASQIEPILIVGLGVLVLILALGVFLPIWDLGTAALGKK